MTALEKITPRHQAQVKSLAKRADKQHKNEKKYDERRNNMSINRDSENFKKERRVEHLINLVEKQTRTERHLEEHSDISSSKENIEHAKEINEERRSEIENLKNILSHGENCNNNYRENTEKRLLYTEGYLNHNAENMDEKAFKNAKEKQEHRKEQLDQLK